MLSHVQLWSESSPLLRYIKCTKSHFSSNMDLLLFLSSITICQGLLKVGHFLWPCVARVGREHENGFVTRSWQIIRFHLRVCFLSRAIWFMNNCFNLRKTRALHNIDCIIIHFLSVLSLMVYGFYDLYFPELDENASASYSTL